MVGKIKNQDGFGLTIVLLAVVLVVAIGAAGYIVYKNNSAYKTPPAISNWTPPKKAGNTPPSTAPNAAEIGNIKDSISSGNTAALEGYMAASVNVVIAASEAAAAKTPTEATKSLDYISPGGSNTWNFNQSLAAFDKYQAGFYKRYFPVGALVGQSTDGHTVSFQFDSAGKITGIFMAVTAAL